jgi:hypothetical protein
LVANVSALNVCLQYAIELYPKQYQPTKSKLNRKKPLSDDKSFDNPNEVKF